MLQRKHKITQHIFYKVSSTFQKYKHILNIKHTKMTEANKIRRMKEATQSELLSAEESALKDERSNPTKSQR